MCWSGRDCLVVTCKPDTVFGAAGLLAAESGDGVGSGLVESGCKAVIGQRLKLSGMRWTVTGAEAITTLRCQQASRPEDRICHAPHNQTPAA